MRRVLVTGGARGMGKAIAERYAAAGWTVVAPGRAQLDLASTASTTQWLAGPGKDLAVDALVNNAGENKINTLEKIALADWERILAINLTGAFLLTQALCPGMAARGFGRVVSISSVYGALARPGRAAYSASKAGLEGLTRTVALEYGPKGVLANAVAPGFIETEMTRRNNSPEVVEALVQQTAVRRLGTPAEIAALVFMLGSEENTYLTGQTVVIDGGFSCQ